MWLKAAEEIPPIPQMKINTKKDSERRKNQ